MHVIVPGTRQVGVGHLFSPLGQKEFEIIVVVVVLYKFPRPFIELD